MPELIEFLYEPPSWFYFLMICVGIAVLNIGDRNKSDDHDKDDCR